MTISFQLDAVQSRFEDQQALTLTKSLSALAEGLNQLEIERTDLQNWINAVEALLYERYKYRLAWRQASISGPDSFRPNIHSVAV